MSGQSGPVLPYETPGGGGLRFDRAFVSGHGKAIVLMVMVGAATLFHCVAVGTDFAQVHLLQRIKMHLPLFPGEARQNDLRVNMVSGAAMLLTIGGMVF